MKQRLKTGIFVALMVAGTTALASCRNLDVVEEHRCVMSAAIRQANAPLVERLLTTPYIDTNDISGCSGGWLPCVEFSRGTEQSKVRMLRALFAKGADANLILPSTTPVGFYARKPEHMQIYIEHGLSSATVFERRNGSNLLQIFTQVCDSDSTAFAIAQQLWEATPDLGYVNKDGQHIGHFAAFRHSQVLGVARPNCLNEARFVFENRADLLAKPDNFNMRPIDYTAVYVALGPTTLCYPYSANPRFVRSSAQVAFERLLVSLGSTPANVPNVRSFQCGSFMRLER